jgi:hypothetical protein
MLSHSLPLFSSFRIPSRYTIPFIQFAALTLAWAFRSFTTMKRVPALALNVIGALAVAGAAQLIVVNQWNLKGVFSDPPFDTTFHWMRGPHQITTDTESSPYAKGSPMLRALVQSQSFYNCYESLQLARGAGGGPQVVDANQSGRLRDLDFTPNKLTFSIADGATDARIVLNQNWSPGWTTDAGTIEVRKPTELSSVTVPRGVSGTFSFAFVPTHLVEGTVMLIAALAATAAAWRRSVQPIFSEPAPPPR